MSGEAQAKRDATAEGVSRSNGTNAPADVKMGDFKSLLSAFQASYKSLVADELSRLVAQPPTGVPTRGFARALLLLACARGPHSHSSVLTLGSPHFRPPLVLSCPALNLLHYSVCCSLASASVSL